MKKHLKSGIKRSAFRQTGSQDSTEIRKPENVITSGSMVQDPVDHVLKFIMTEGKNTAVANRIVK